mmetsp:Transcript_9107/g.25448  ORF Transcript_9107/g.25448 Transcript_9107/m.25448 type:complete len:295 (+) Transcript_9107:391-1275(+)
MRVGVIELAAVEVGGAARAAAEAHGPEVISRERQQRAGGALDGDGGHAVHIQIAKAHGPPDVEARHVRELNPPRVHELLATGCCRAHGAVLIEVHVVVVRVHVGPEVQVAEDHAKCPANTDGQEEKDEPLWLVDLQVGPELLPDCAQGQEARHDHGQEAQRAEAVGDGRPQMVQLEGQHRVDEAEEGPGEKQALEDGYEVHPLPRAAYEEVLAITAEATEAAVELGLGEVRLPVGTLALHWPYRSRIKCWSTSRASWSCARLVGVRYQPADADRAPHRGRLGGGGGAKAAAAAP